MSEMTKVPSSLPKRKGFLKHNTRMMPFIWDSPVPHLPRPLCSHISSSCEAANTTSSCRRRATAQREGERGTRERQKLVINLQLRVTAADDWWWNNYNNHISNVRLYVVRTNNSEKKEITKSRDRGGYSAETWILDAIFLAARGRGSILKGIERRVNRKAERRSGSGKVVSKSPVRALKGFQKRVPWCFGFLNSFEGLEGHRRVHGHLVFN